MVFNAENLETVVTGSLPISDRKAIGWHDPRITPIGKLLRGGIDESPQLVNIIRQEMSLVGPRVPSKTEISVANKKGARVAFIQLIIGQY